MTEEKRWMLKYLGERFKLFRTEKGYSRNEVADIIGINVRTLAAYERGEREVSIDAAERMASCYGVTFELLTDYKFIYKKMKEAQRRDEGSKCDIKL